MGNPLIPPFDILKAFFLTGGNSYLVANRVVWDEFTLTPQKYENLKSNLIRNHNKKFEVCDEEVRNIDEWDCWSYCKRTGAPFNKYKELMLKCREVEGKLYFDTKSLDESSQLKLLLKLTDLNESLQEIYDEYGF